MARGMAIRAAEAQVGVLCIRTQITPRGHPSSVELNALFFRRSCSLQYIFFGLTYLRRGVAGNGMWASLVP